MDNKGSYNFKNRKLIDRRTAEDGVKDLNYEVQRPALEELNREIQYKGSAKKMLLFMTGYMAFIGAVIYIIYLLKK